MERRFGLKDVLVIVLLAAILVSIWLAMVQFDRQWQTVQQVETKVDEHTATLIAQEKQIREMRTSIRKLAEAPQTPPALMEAIAQIQTGLKQLSEGQLDGDALQQQLAALQERINAVEREAAAALPPADEYFDRLQEARDNENFAYGDWFVDAFGQTVGKLTPIIQTDAYQSRIEQFVLESLIVRDPDTFEWRPWIAHDWQVSDDGITIRFDLREDVVFSNGEPLTADDVVYTYELIMNPDINAPALRSYYDNFESVTAEGDYRVVFRMKQPYFKSLEFSGGIPILSRAFYEQFTPQQFNEMPGLLVGSGPYKLDVDPREWRPGTGKVELVRNDRYWGPRPSFDRLVWREISDQTAELTSFRNREIDLYGVQPEKYNRLKDDQDLLDHADLYVLEAPTFGYRYIGWNQRREGEATFFADRRVRQAMTLLTNRREMAEQLMAGLATVATGPFHYLGPQANPDVEPWPYHPDRARELLADAGWTDRDGDGVLENAAGDEFRFKLIYPSSNENYRQMAFYLQDAYERAGLVMEPDPTEWNTMLQRIDERDFDAITLGWTGNIEGDPKQIFHSESMAEGGSNYVSYANEQLDALIDKARLSLDVDERMAMWHEVHRILHDDQPYTFLFFSKSPVFIDKRIHNVKVTRTGLNDRTEMYVPKPLQLWTK